MRNVVCGAAVAVALVIATLGIGTRGGEALAQRASASHAGATGLVTLSAAVGDKIQQLTVIDPDLRVLSVYHIELTTGEVSLKSVRNIHWDLQMTEFNGKSPLPREIRTLLEQK